MLNIIKENDAALAELSKGNELAAQTILRKNAKHKPCCFSLNNLGVYYSQYGMILKNGHMRSAKKIGLAYLLKASSYESDWRNYISIATAFLEFGNVNRAYHFLLEAYALRSDYQIMYNMGVCLFRMEKFQEAICIFESLCIDEAVDCIIENGGQHPFLILAYCQIKLHNDQECIKYIQRYRNIYRTGELLDIFHLRYLCHMYEAALLECSELLKEWYPTKSILALIAECVSYFPSYTGAIDSALCIEQKSNGIF